ncbi:glycosyltransferase family 2 protein [Phototrophicus methaneseepsis]|uniref:Glycosyltransferase family 2 protein n=1 Tax=Phototrophicus methaneseepsis TaxID=2710758 RepID=A0A7S8ICZ4_9CHLR|nr:glycosyltransferase family A protein [Phototrophicus methaneseepsis]QPC82035.1 glycosyltransferase family 2 protein [Phototrophicus methaneseepsis]
MMPKISVIIPCYNAAQTLPIALASLLAQTYDNWECIVIDDGSSDRPIDIVDAANDTRIHFHRFEENRGRAAARQYALEMADGSYLCMIDADDWIYPHKLALQAKFMSQHPEIAVVSTGMAIVDEQNKIVRARVATQDDVRLYAPLGHPQFPPIAHGPSMIRLDIAKQHQYDPSFRLSQDVDFLLKMLIDHPFAALHDLTYVYSEITSVNLKKILETHSYSRQMFLKYRQKYPSDVYRNIAVIHLKNLIYFMAFNLGFGEQMIKRRSQQPSSNEVKNFYNAWDTVKMMLENVFSNKYPVGHLD